MGKIGLGSAGCIIKDKKILLLHRIENCDEWEFPGGGIEFGETPEEAAVREVEEEANVKVKSKCLFTINSHIIRKGEQHIWFYYLCEIEEGNVCVGDDAHSEYGWFNFEELREKKNLAMSVSKILSELEKIMN